MNERIVITVLGADKTGIVANVSGKLSEMKINIIDISQSVFDGNVFGMIMLVELSEKKYTVNEIKENLKELEEKLNVKIYAQHTNIFMNMHRI